MPLIISHIAPHYYGGALDGPARFTDEINAIINGAPDVTSPYVRNPIAVTYAWTMMNMESNLVSTKNGEPLFAAVPFRTTEERDVTYYHPHDWTYCDDAELWHSNGSQAEYVPSWKSASGAVSFDTANAARGEAALKLDYTADADGKITVSPVLETGYPDTDVDYSHYRIIRFLLKNEGGAAVPSLLRFTDSDGVLFSGEKAEESIPDVFTDVPEVVSGETDPSGKAEKDSVLVPVLIGVAVVFAAAAVAVVLLKNKKKPA